MDRARKKEVSLPEELCASDQERGLFEKEYRLSEPWSPCRPSIVLAVDIYDTSRSILTCQRLMYSRFPRCVSIIPDFEQRLAQKLPMVCFTV